jgi:ABC-type Fe3+-siderophore transport system permease subunit
MRKSCRYPFAAIILMCLVGGVIAVLLFHTGVVFEFGFSLVIALLAGIAVAAIITVVLCFLHRTGAQRLEGVRTWPQN